MGNNSLLSACEEIKEVIRNRDIVEGHSNDYYSYSILIETVAEAATVEYAA